MTTIDTVTEALAMAVSELTAREDRDCIPLADAMLVVREILMTRNGDVVTEEFATERARNIVQALSGLRVGR